MAKVSMVERERKRARIVKKYAARRAEMKSIISSPGAGYEERQAAVLALQKLPRNSSPTRMRNRCSLSGRPRGYYRKFGLARNMLRKAAMKGDVPGLVMSSW